MLSTSLPLLIDPSNFRVAFRDHFHAVCPTGPVCLNLTAPREDHCTVVESTPTREQKHSQIWLSWRVAKEWDKSGLMVLKKKLRTL